MFSDPLSPNFIIITIIIVIVIIIINIMPTTVICSDWPSDKMPAIMRSDIIRLLQDKAHAGYNQVGSEDIEQVEYPGCLAKLSMIKG